MTADEPETEGLTCREVVGLRADYLESALGQERIDELEEHPGGMRTSKRWKAKVDRLLTALAGRLLEWRRPRKGIRDGNGTLEDRRLVFGHGAAVATGPRPDRLRSALVAAVEVEGALG